MSRLAIARRVAAWIVAAYLALKFARNGLVKFDAQGFWSVPFERWGYPPWLRVGVGVAEVTGAIAMLIPRVGAYGAGLLLVVMVGATVTRARDGAWGDVLSNAVYAAALVWIAREWIRSRATRTGAAR